MGKGNWSFRYGVDAERASPERDAEDVLAIHTCPSQSMDGAVVVIASAFEMHGQHRRGESGEGRDSENLGVAETAHSKKRSSQNGERRSNRTMTRVVKR